MTIIDALTAGSGNARTLLRGVAPEKGGRLLLSGDRWGTAEVALGDLQLERSDLVGVSVTPTFSRCRFDDCLFQDLRSEGGFWGQTNHFARCRFHRVDLIDIGSPCTTFEDCLFDTLSLTEYAPHQTLFRGCTFRHLRVLALSPSATFSFRATNPELEGRRTHLVFEDCRFEGAAFHESRFDKVAFERCSMEGLDAHTIQFDEVVGCQFDDAIPYEEIEAYDDEVERIPVP